MEKRMSGWSDVFSDEKVTGFGAGSFGGMEAQSGTNVLAACK
jgi:hypothetical protein